MQEYIGICQAIVQGISTGLFDVIAHPDRSFRRCKEFGNEEMNAAQEIINAAVSHKLILEQNLSSVRRENQYREEFCKKWRNTIG